MRSIRLEAKLRQVQRQEEVLLDETHMVRSAVNTASTSYTALGVLVSGQSSECRIARVERGVCKAGSRVRVEEGRALKFAQSLQLPVPAVYEVKVSGQQTEIVMELVDGERVEEAWLSMNSEEKRSVAKQIGQIVTAMRYAQSHQCNIGAVRGPARDCRQISDYYGGPFANEAEFNTFVLDLLRGTPSSIRKTLAKASDMDKLAKLSSRMVI